MGKTNNTHIFYIATVKYIKSTTKKYKEIMKCIASCIYSSKKEKFSPSFY